jgi:predicted ATPase/class 3 adenylate cyclase/Tfp pilus assembly protein PilF
MHSADDSPTVKALLMSDMVGSTQLGARLGDEAMAGVWRAHDRLVRDLLAAWNGREIEKTDGVHALFDQADDALGCALAYHRGLREAGLPVSVRAGIHAGPVTLRRNEPADVARGAKPMEVDGLAVSIASRVMATARGGQTLLSGDAVRALESLPTGLRAHGHWRFKGVPEPVELFEVGSTGEGGPFHEPPEDGPRAFRVAREGDDWLPVSAIGHSLAAERDSFVGRRDELALLAKRLEAEARLISVLGVGGTGKTRLVTRHARHVLAHYPGGVWFCDLSQARTLDGIHFAVAQGLKMPLGRTDPARELAAVIAGRGRCLVIVDNFEQVVHHAEATIGRWLDAAPRAQFVVTSREVLGIVGEEVLPLAPLSPGDGEALFIQRAQAASLGYVPDEADRAAIGRLVVTLDGLPLAIELTASRVRAMPPAAMLAHLESRLDLAHSGRGRVVRQATLRAAFDWSWELLNDDERVALSVLSVFEGGIALDAAAAVMAPPNGGQALGVTSTLLANLVDKSLLRQAGPARYAMLETVREYAASRLAAQGAVAEERAALLHWRHFASLTEQSATSLRCAEAGNLVAACRAATRAGDSDAATRCLVVAWAALKLIGPYQVAVALAEDIGAIETSAREERALAHWVAADAHDLLGQAELARHHLDAGLALVGEEGTECRARLLLIRGARQVVEGKPEAAAEALGEALLIAESLGLPRLRILALNELGRQMDFQARWPQAQACYEQALALAVSEGDRRLEGGLLGNLGGIFHDRGELSSAQVHYERALRAAEDLGDDRWAGNARCNLGLLAHEQGRLGDAHQQFDLALRMARQSGHVRLEYVVLCNLGLVLTAEGYHEDAGAHFESAVLAARTAEDRRSEGQFQGYQGLNLARRGQLASARAALTAGEQLLRAVGDRLSLGLLLCDRTEVELLAGDVTAAHAAAHASRCIADELACGEDSELRRRWSRVVAALPQVSC